MRNRLDKQVLDHGRAAAKTMKTDRANHKFWVRDGEIFEARRKYSRAPGFATFQEAQAEAQRQIDGRSKHLDRDMVWARFLIAKAERLTKALRAKTPARYAAAMDGLDTWEQENHPMKTMYGIV